MKTHHARVMSQQVLQGQNHNLNTHTRDAVGTSCGAKMWLGHVTEQQSVADNNNNNNNNNSNNNIIIIELI